MPTTDPLLDPFRLRMTIEVVKAAVMRKIMCGCGAVLDVRTAVLLTTPTRATLDCGLCFDRSLAAAAEQHGTTPRAVKDGLIANGCEVDDGRILHGKGKVTDDTLYPEPEAEPAVAIHPDQEVLFP